MDIEWRFEDYGAAVGVVGLDTDSGASLACRVRLDSVTDADKAREIGMRRIAERLGAMNG